MPVRLIQQERVEKELLARKCIKIKDYTHGSGSLWMTKAGFYFTVPKEPDGQTDENTLRAILQEVDMN